MGRPDPGTASNVGKAPKPLDPTCLTMQLQCLPPMPPNSFKFLPQFSL